MNRASLTWFDVNLVHDSLVQLRAYFPSLICCSHTPRLVLKVLVHIRGGEGGISPEVKLLSRILVPVDIGFQKVFPVVGLVDVSGSQDGAFAVAELVEHEKRMVAP